jgi:hypothetical protein
VRRLPAVVLAVLVAATVGAFFVVQHVKVTTPLLDGFPRPDPNVIDPLAGGTCGGAAHRVTRVSFYLLHRSDDVNVYVIDQGGDIVDTVASGRHMRIGVRHPDGEFSWDGRQSDGRLAPDGTYYFQVALIHQGRTVTISDASGPEPITVESSPPRPRVTSVSPGVIPHAGTAGTRIDVAGDDARGGFVNLYRTDQPGPPLVKSFGLPYGARRVVWDGTVGGAPAPAGTYLVGVKMVDGACRTGVFPARIPPAPGRTRGAGVTVRYLAAQPPLDPVPAGSRAPLRVDSAAGAYKWSLRRVGDRGTVGHGSGSGSGLLAPVPPGRAGLYELSLRAGAYSTDVPIVASAPTSQPVLVVLPSLTWQGLNPVDDDGDGIPDTLSGGGPVELARPLAHGLPAGFADQAGLVGYLDRTHRSYDLTTDLGLIQGVGPALSGHALVVLAGSERWLPASVAAALRSYAEQGGHVLSLGIGSLLRSVRVRGGRTLDPSPPARVDWLGARPGRPVSLAGARLAVMRDDLRLFRGAAARLGGFASMQPFTAPAPVLSAAGTSPGGEAVVAYRLGRGTVVDVGLVGFGSALARNRAAQALLSAALKLG